MEHKIYSFINLFLEYYQVAIEEVNKNKKNIFNKVENFLVIKIF